MSTHKHIDRICLVAVLLSLLLSIVFVNGEALGIQAASRILGYENRLFDTSRVHTIDIVMDDWDSFIQTCRNEEYSPCSVVIDGEAFKNVGIRGKGNTSLSSVASMDSDRYSFKIEFDQYDSTKSYHGLDKLSLNNLIQDNTYMKDYLTYQLMGQLGASSPLCSYVYLTVNGEDWGLYLAVEAIEDSFLRRNYGSDYGELYKPDSMGFGGGRGNGKDFNMDEFMQQDQTEPQPRNIPQDFDPSAAMSGQPDVQRPSGGRGGNMSGMGSGETKLQYIDDDPDSYSAIFDSAKTDITDADKTRLIQSLKALSTGENIENVVAVDDVIRYFAVHNFVCNGDSYTGSMIHNYYLYEENGQLSMLPWDYNLAFGTFHSSNATSAVNTPIDTPVSGTTGEDRPMIAWIFADEEYTRLYHQYFAQFLESTDFATLIDDTAALIDPYVERDPTKFCTYEQFRTGVSAIREFCLLREQSILGQLDGTIPSTTQGQSADSTTLVDAANLTISDMGTMGMGGNRNGGNRPGSEFSPGEDRHPAENTQNTTPPEQENEQSGPSLQPPGQFPQSGAGGRGGMQRPGGMGLMPTDPPSDAQGQSSTAEQQPTMPQIGGGQQPGGQNGEMTSPGNSSGSPFPMREPGTTASAGYQTLLLLGASVLVLLVGLVIAFKFKR